MPANRRYLNLLKGALLDIWQADHTGTYDNRGFNLRGKLHTDDEGRYSLRTTPNVAAHLFFSTRRPG